MRLDDERDLDNLRQKAMEEEKLWRTLEIYQLVRASHCLNAVQLEDLRIFLGLSKGDL